MTTPQREAEFEELRNSVQTISRKEIPPYLNDTYHGTVPKELLKSLSDSGLLAMRISEEHGGSNLTASEIACVLHEVARVDLGVAIVLSVHAMVAGIIDTFGSPEQRDSILPKASSGEHLLAFALTEPGAGSDAKSIRTQVKETQKGFQINGEKCYITSAGFADYYFVVAKNEQEGSASAFLVPATCPGLTIGKPEKKMGAELSPIASLNFNDAFLPKSALVGEVGQGFQIAFHGLASGRVNIAACANGLSEEALMRSKSHLEERVQFGQKLREFGALQSKIADMYIQLEAARLLTMKAAKVVTDTDVSSKSALIAAATAKTFATDAAMKITTEAVQLHGGSGYISDVGIEKLMRGAKMLQIVEGANEIQRSIIARWFLY